MLASEIVRCKLGTRSFSQTGASAAARSKQPGRKLLRTPGAPRGSRWRQFSNPAQVTQKQYQSLQSGAQQSPNIEKASASLQNTENDSNSLLSPVNIPSDRHGILRESHPAVGVLANSSIVVQRRIEMMNVFLGFEQANRYVIMDGQGNHVGYLAEQDHGLGMAMARQAFRTHRSFTTHVFDRDNKEVLRFHRPFAWISSCIRIYDAVSSGSPPQSSSSTISDYATGTLSASPLNIADMRIIGEAQQQWAPLRRKYNLFLHRPRSEVSQDKDAIRLTAGDLPLSNSMALQVAEQGNEEVGFSQFAYVDEPFLSWDFSLLSEDKRLIGSVNRNFAGMAREIFTDTGVYALRMDAAGLAEEPRHLISHTASRAEPAPVSGMTLDQRAVMLATAVSIDFDYFSRHSHAGAGGFFPVWFPIGGGASAEEAGATGKAGEMTDGGQAAEAASNAAKESAMTGAGTMAGYEAMQRGVYGDRQDADDASPTAQGLGEQPPVQGSQDTPSGQEDVWGEQTPWDSNSGGQAGGGGDGGGEGGGDGSWLDDFFG